VKVFWDERKIWKNCSDFVQKRSE